MELKEALVNICNLLNGGEVLNIMHDGSGYISDFVDNEKIQFDTIDELFEYLENDD